MDTHFDYDLPDFEIPPMNPMEQLMEIVSLAHQCVSLRKAYINVELFGGCREKISATIIDDIDVVEYPAIQSYLVTPKVNAWNATNIRYEADMTDQPSLQKIIDRLNEVLSA